MQKVTVALLMAGAFAAAADAAPFQNGSFEQGSFAPCNTFSVPNGSTIITGWTVSAGNIDWLGSPPSCGWQPSNGTNSLEIFNELIQYLMAAPEWPGY